MAIHKYISRHCPKCNKDVDFEIVMRYVDYNGIIPCLRCPSCETECPAYSFDNFIKTGKCNEYEFDRLSVDFDINTGKIIKTKQSHEVDWI